MDKTKITIIGAGAVGLAVAAELSKTYPKDLMVIEQYDSFGNGASSRNSEIIHDWLPYSRGSLKETLCREGNRMLYELPGVKHKKTGKFIVAKDESEIEKLEELYKKGMEKGMEGLRMLSKQEVKKMEPKLNVPAAIFCPQTGIIDTHGLMKYLENHVGRNNLSYNTRLVGLKRLKKGEYRLRVKYRVRPDGSYTEDYRFNSDIVINCAGLECDRVAEMAGIDIDEAGYRLHPSKGEYWKITKHLFNTLIFPLPTQDTVGVLGLVGFEDGHKFGPNKSYVDRTDDGGFDYNVDPSRIDEFYDAFRKILPIKKEDLQPDMSGVRAKIQRPGQPRQDFIIKHETGWELDGFINLIGIESPGLTCALAIARDVAKMLEEIYA